MFRRRVWQHAPLALLNIKTDNKIISQIYFTVKYIWPNPQLEGPCYCCPPDHISRNARKRLGSQNKNGRTIFGSEKRLIYPSKHRRKEKHKWNNNPPDSGVSVVYCKRKRNILWNVRVLRGIIEALKQQPRPIWLNQYARKKIYIPYIPNSNMPNVKRIKREG